jgi:phosphatidylglycerophosphatase C
MNLALFDFDGTITTRETWPAFMRLAVPTTRQVVATAALSPMIVGYKLGAVPARVVRSVLTKVGLRGIPENQVLRAGRHFTRTALPGLIRPMAHERIEWHQARGDIVVVVSGSLELFLSEWCAQRGLRLIGTRLESKDGVLTGRFLGRECCGEEKAARVREAHTLRDFTDISAYGDTLEDREMLSLAGRRYYRWQEVA